MSETASRIYRVPGLLRLFFCAIGVLLGAVHGAQSSRPTEYEVKAAYLANFGRFVEWPAAREPAPESFNVCVLGDDPFGELLDAAVKGEVIGGVPMAAKRLSSPQEATECRILFLPASQSGQLAGILSTLRTSPVLTVSDMPGFARRGGMIQFITEGGRIRFIINLAPAKRAGLTLSSQLLKLSARGRRTP